MPVKIIRKALTVFRLFYHDPFSIRFALAWIKSMQQRHTPLTDHIPWMSFIVQAWLKAYLKPGMTVFEYGSGGSTLFISPRVKKLVSVEHNKNWYNQVSQVLLMHRITNCEYILCEPEKENHPDGTLTRSNYTSSKKKYAGLCFEKYVRSIEKYPDSSFDLVIIDGRSRIACISHALRKIKEGGYLLLDDSDRLYYTYAHTLLADYKRTDLSGLRPYCTELGHTAIWKITSTN